MRPYKSIMRESARTIFSFAQFRCYCLSMNRYIKKSSKTTQQLHMSIIVMETISSSVMTFIIYGVTSAGQISRLITKYEERPRKFLALLQSRASAMLLLRVWCFFFAEIIQVPGATFTNIKSCENDALTA